MTVRELLAHLNELSIGDLDKEVYVDAEGDEYKRGALHILVNPNDENEIVGVLLCESDPNQMDLPFDGVEEVH